MESFLENFSFLRQKMQKYREFIKQKLKLTGESKIVELSTKKDIVKTWILFHKMAMGDDLPMFKLCIHDMFNCSP